MSLPNKLAQWVTTTTRRHLRWRLEDTLEDWFLAGLHWQQSQPNTAPLPGVYYEFGVGDGRSASAFARAASRFCAQTGEDVSRFHIVGFDSFEGLPSSDAREDRHPDWPEGVYEHSPSSVEEKIRAEGFPRGNLHLVAGFFENTLTEDLRDVIPGGPSIVMIDCDLYSSTVTALRWVKDVLSSGALLYFDDLWAFHGHPDYGELAAIRDVQRDPDFGFLTPFPQLGSADRAFVYARNDLEF